MLVFRPGMNHTDRNETSTAKGFFGATAWSTIRDGQSINEEVRRAAVERLLIRYRRPILRHIEASLSAEKRGGAEDLAQAFILQCLRLNFLEGLSPEKGRFRTFIKACIRNFLWDQYDRDKVRGSCIPHVPIPPGGQEDRGFLDPAAQGLSPEEVLDREWAFSVLESAMKQLQQECASVRQKELFEALQGHLGKTPEARTTKEIAEKLGMNEGAVYTAMNRLRGRLGELIREEIRQTVGTEEDWREELKYLIELIGK